MITSLITYVLHLYYEVTY